MPLTAQYANADLTPTSPNALTAVQVPLMVDPATGRLLVASTGGGGGGGGGDASAANQTTQISLASQQLTQLISANAINALQTSQLSQLLTGPLSIIDVSPDVLTSGTLTGTGAAGTQDAGGIRSDTQGSYTAIVRISGSWSGTINFFQTIDSVGYDAIKGTNATDGSYVSSVTGNGEWKFNVGGFKELWAVASSVTGTATIKINSSNAQNIVEAISHGGSADGTTPAFPSVLVGGKDLAGNKRPLLLDTTGALQISTASLPSLSTDVVSPLASAQPVRLVGQRTWQAKFTDVNASALSTNDFTQIYKSAGITLSQASGALAVVASTNANDEWLAVSTRSWQGALSLRQKTILSQRIANNNFWVILGDKIGDGLTLTVNSTTSVTVSNVPGTWSASNVGQFMFMGAVGGLAGMTPGRFAIASVSGSNITFTVPAMGISSGTTTCSLFGWNHAKLLYTSTTATNAAADTQLNGWASGDTTLSINTTASPGHLAQIFNDGHDIYFADALVASSATPSFTTRGSRYSFIPDETVPLYLYLWVQNGTAAPATTTTWTLQEIAVENFPNNPVFLAGNKQQGQQAPLPVVLPTNAAIGLGQVGGTNTVTGGVAGLLGVGGNIAAGTAATANPIPIGSVDTSNLTRRILSDTAGEIATIGSSEILSNFSVGTGAAAVTDGTNGKTIFLPPVESDLYLDISAISTGPTMQIEGSYNNSTWFIIPLTRIDTTAASLQYASVAAFTPAVGNRYKGKTYGVPMIRVHLTAGTTSNTVGLIRVIPRTQDANITVSPFNFTATGTTEAVGSTNGQVYTGSVRTLKVPCVGSAKAILHIENMGTSTVVLEGSMDNVTFTALNMQPVDGGATVASTTAAGMWEADLGAYTYVRVHCTAYTSGNCFGYIKIVPASTNRVATSGAVTSFTSTTSASMLAANGLRKGFTVVNEGAGTCAVLLASGTASSTNYTVQIASGSERTFTDYTGPVTAIMLTAGTCRVTELT